MSAKDRVDKYKCEIRFERAKDQKPLNLGVPKPSQRDEWKLYDEMVGSDFRARKGDLEYSRWREFEDKQRTEKEMWLQGPRVHKDLFEGSLCSTAELRSEGASNQAPIIGIEGVL